MSFSLRSTVAVGGFCHESAVVVALLGRPQANPDSQPVAKSTSSRLLPLSSRPSIATAAARRRVSRRLSPIARSAMLMAVQQQRACIWRMARTTEHCLLSWAMRTAHIVYAYILQRKSCSA